jgi:hypothetical protein
VVATGFALHHGAGMSRALLRISGRLLQLLRAAPLSVAGYAARPEPMTLHRSDYDQAARYLRYACELLEREAFGRTVTLREVLQMAARRLCAGDHYVGDAAAEITVLRQVAEKVPIADARTEILKAIAVLRDRVGR